MQDNNDQENNKSNPKNVLLAALEKKKQKQAGYNSNSNGKAGAKGKSSGGKPGVNVGNPSLGHRPTGR